MNFKMKLATLIVWTLICSIAAAPYKKLNYYEVIARVKELVSQHPDIFEYFDTYSRYPGLIPESVCAGKPLELPLIRVTNFLSPEQQIRARPQVFLIGPLHGDEIMGTQVLPRYMEWIVKFKRSRFWHTLNTRMLLIMPTTNPEGFCENRRAWRLPDDLELMVDPNRDFPYHVDQKACMITPSARAINEVVREHLVASSLVFHGGDNSITYPWGNMPHLTDKAPEFFAFRKLAEEMRSQASDFNEYNVREYNIGTMTEVVYPVDGGLEDWIYAGSWDDPANVPQCKPRNKPDYPPERSKVLPNTNKVMIYLVEAGEDKSPPESTFGDDRNWDHKGHLSRNLLVVDTLSKFTTPEFIVYNLTAENSPDSDHRVLNFKYVGRLYKSKITLEMQQLSSGTDSLDRFNVDCSDGSLCSAVIPVSGRSIYGLKLVLKANSDGEIEQGKTHVNKLWQGKYRVENNGYVLSSKDSWTHTFDVRHPLEETFIYQHNSTLSFSFKKGLLVYLSPQPEQVLELFAGVERPSIDHQLEGVIGITGWTTKVISEVRSTHAIDDEARYLQLELKIATDIRGEQLPQEFVLELMVNPQLPKTSIVFLQTALNKPEYKAEVEAGVIELLAGAEGLLSAGNNFAWKWRGPIRFVDTDFGLQVISNTIADSYIGQTEFVVRKAGFSKVVVQTNPLNSSEVEYHWTGEHTDDLPTKVVLLDGRKRINEKTNNSETLVGEGIHNIPVGSVMGLELYWGDQVIQSLAILRARRVHLEQQQVTLLEQESPQILKKEGSLISTIFMWTIIVVVTGFVAWCVMYVRAYRLEHFGSKSSNEMSKVAAYGTPNFETASFDA